MARHSYKGKRKPEIELPNLAGLSRERLLEVIEKLSLYSTLVVNQIPITIFDNRELSVLETVVKYLKENLGFRFSEIATLLNRDERNIWTTYRDASIKREQRFIIRQVKFFIPITIFQDRRVSVLEAIVEYLKEQRQCSLHEIASLLNRDQRTVWTVYSRVQKKRKIRA